VTGSQHKTPSQPANNPYDQPPLWYTLPRPPDNGTNESQGTEPTPGGPIVSSRQGDCEGQARKLGRFNIIKLATTDYHIGTLGVAVLSHSILLKCGYSNIASSDVVTCHTNIIAVHRQVRELWYNTTLHTCGPQINRIITKLLKLLLTLESTGTETVVNFYDHLQESTTGLTIAIMPFDTVMIQNGLEGLCVPRLGVNRCHLMSKALMELLPRLIPGSISPQINAVLASVRYELGNGYNYLWRVLKLTIPRFNSVVPLQVPQWSNSDDIFSFAQAYLLYFHLQGKMHFHYGNRTRSGIFLRAIQFSNFADTVTTLLFHANSFRKSFDDDYLPPHLRIHGLATSIHQNTQVRMRDLLSL
jgi:hypothetical protein